ncbi:MAG: hypothetical protein ACRDSL_06835 [Pseudonocardiaceae bacterium]
MTTRRTLTVKGRQGTDVTVVVETYRGKVWLVSADPPFSVEAIMEPSQAESLGDLLARAARDARGSTKDTAT